MYSRADCHIQEGKCFQCGVEGHVAAQCPERPLTSKGKEAEKPPEPPRPKAAGVPDILGRNKDLEEREMCLAWGKVRDQLALIFFDQGASDNIIYEDLAKRLGIKVEELGRALEADQMFHGDLVPVTPLIGKLRLHV